MNHSLIYAIFEVYNLELTLCQALIKDFEKIEKKIELKPKDFVLVRDDNNDTWELDIFGRITKDPWCEFTYICVSGSFAYCIPFNSETEHLLGKTDDCPEKYK